ncbi:hypothetical protein C7C46_18000 [Streptomyces tateyamensis]|uniref:Uncharacterized protein n=1 Tax=Streptomyces tateyamensis TaxID=565073 RepID=A0A2V4P4G7_9ACTN|nr:hypothetical protein C7C46_18000 [Streptomyces tateyamensis]
MRPGGAKPPAVPYVPSTPGELLLDALSGRVGVFMGRQSKRIFMRPPGGGVEWDTDPAWVLRAPEAK